MCLLFGVFVATLSIKCRSYFLKFIICYFGPFVRSVIRLWLACVRNKERDRESRTHLKYNPKNGILFCYGLKINKRYTSLLYAKSHSNFMCVSGRMQNYGNGRIYTKSHLKCAQTHQMCVWVWLCICVYNQWRLFIRFDSMAMPMKNSINLRYSSFSMARGQNSARLFVCFYSRAKYKCAINVPMEFPHYRGVVVTSCQKMQMPSVYCICFALALACVSNKPNSNSCSVLFCFVLPCQSYCDGRKMRWFVACFFGWRFATIVLCMISVQSN